MIGNISPFLFLKHWEVLLFHEEIKSISSVQLGSHVQLFATPWTTGCQDSLSITNSWSLFKLMSFESLMPSNHLILCRPLLLLPSIFASIRIFSNESVPHIRWPKYWSFSISPSNEYSGLISFRTDWFDLLTVQGTLKSLLQHHSSKAPILWCSAFFMVQLSHVLYSFPSINNLLASLLSILMGIPTKSPVHCTPNLVLQGHV